jgi:eukaryotic-like serine/threonine-protein kinase
MPEEHGEDQDVRFGRIAVAQGFLTTEELNQCLEDQVRCAAAGRAERLGEVMVRLGFLTRTQMQRLLEYQDALTAQVTQIGPYELIAKVGEGGMGAVFRAKDTRANREVALKILPRSKAKDHECLERFEREARMLIRIDHPNIVKGYDLGEAGGYHYFAMEFINGTDVYGLISQQDRLAQEDVLSIAIQIASALEYAQEQNIVHRDIKPDNILVDKHGVAKLTDLGLVLDSEGAKKLRLTGSGSTIGTPFYISPEQARGESSLDVRSDIYSLGCTLYEMVTGKPPFEGETAAVIMLKHIKDTAPSPLEHGAKITDGFCLVVEKMLAKNRKDRFQSPRELLRDLMRVYQGEPPHARPLPEGKSSIRPSPQRASNVPDLPAPQNLLLKKIRRTDYANIMDRRTRDSAMHQKFHAPRRMWVWIAAAAAAAIAVGALLYFVFGRKRSAPPPPPLKISCRFEDGNAQGWLNGRAVSVSAGAWPAMPADSSGWAFNVGPAGPNVEYTRSTEATRMDFAAGEETVISFLYYTTVETRLKLRVTDEADQKAHLYTIEKTQPGGWRQATVRGEAFQDVNDARLPLAPGRVYIDPAISFGDARRAADREAPLLIAEVTIRMERASVRSLPSPSESKFAAVVAGKSIEIERKERPSEQMSLARDLPVSRPAEERTAAYLAVQYFFPLRRRQATRALYEAARIYDANLNRADSALGTLEKITGSGGVVRGPDTTDAIDEALELQADILQREGRTEALRETLRRLAVEATGARRYEGMVRLADLLAAEGDLRGAAQFLEQAATQTAYPEPAQKARAKLDKLRGKP